MEMKGILFREADSKGGASEEENTLLWRIVDDERRRIMEEKKYKCHLTLSAEGVTTGTMMLTKEEYEIVKRVTDPSKWDDLEWESWCGSFSISMEEEEE